MVDLPEKRIVNGGIEAIHRITYHLAATRNYLRARLARAQLWSQTYPITEVILVLGPPKRDKEDNMLYEFTFTEEDLEGVDVSHNDALVLTVNICNYDVRRVLIDMGSSSEVMYLNAYN